MKPEKAIEILEKERHYFHLNGQPDQEAAAKLGIEALKLYKDIKADGLRAEDFALPGETLE